MDIIESMREALEVVVAQSLTSSLDSQGDPQLLVIDELQFVLRPAAITFDQGKTLRGNVIAADRRLLLERQKTPSALKEERTVEGVSGPLPVTVRRYEFPPPNAPRDLLKAMYGIHSADDFSVIYRREGSKLTFYYNQDPEAGPQVFGSALEGQLRKAFSCGPNSCKEPDAPLARIAGSTNGSTKTSRDPLSRVGTP